MGEEVNNTDNTELDVDALYNMSDAELDAAFQEVKTSNTVNGLSTNPDLEQPDKGLNEDDDNDEDTGDSEDGDNNTEDEPEGEDGLDNGNIEEGATANNSNDDDDDDDDQDPVDAKATNQPQTRSFKANGVQYSFTDDEIQEKFPQVFAQAMNYTKKMQAISPWRKTIDAIEQAGYNHDDINLAIEVLNGNPEAIGEVLKRKKIDPLDIDSSEDGAQYTPKDYGRDPSELALREVEEEIMKDPEYTYTHRVLTKDWDIDSWNELSANPNNIKLLHNDIKSGVFDNVQPIASKLKLYDEGKHADLYYYKEAAKQYFGQQQQQQEYQNNVRQQQQQQEQVNAIKQDTKKREAANNAAKKRKSATLSKSKAGSSKPDSTNYLDASEKEFEEWYPYK